MAADWSFDPGIVWDDVASVTIPNATGIFALTVGGAAEPVYDLNASPLTNLTSNDYGYVARFKTDDPVGFIHFGSVWQPVVAYEVFVAASNFTALLAAAESAAASATSAAAAAQAAQLAAEDAASSGGGLSIPALNDHLGGDTENLMQRVWGVREPTDAVGGYATLDSDFDHLLSYGPAGTVDPEDNDPADMRGGPAITTAQYDIHERVENP